MTSIFYISEADEDFFILVHPRMRELLSGEKWIATKYFQRTKGRSTKTICEKVKKAKIFIADRPTIYEPASDNELDKTSNYLESDFFLNEAWNSQTNETVLGKVFTAELLFHDQKIKTMVITCEFGKSQKDKIYLARQKDSKHLFLFGKTTDETDNDTLPNLLAIGMNYMEIYTLKNNSDIGSIIFQYTYHYDKATYHRVTKKLFEEDGVDIFQLCASITFHEESKEDKKTKYKYIITIPGSQNNLSTEVPARNIIEFIHDHYAENSVPVLTCPIKRKADNQYPIKFKFYIVPDVTIAEATDSRIIAVYDYLDGSKITQVNKHYGLSAPWKFYSRKHPR